MLVKFLKDWNGSKVGDELELLDDFCKGDLIPRGIVEPVTTEEQAKIKEQADEIVKLKKQLTQAKNKQVTNAPKTK